MNLLIFILIGLGCCHLWSFSTIFSYVRNFVAKIPYLRNPLICPECSSFWIGLFISLFYNPLLTNNIINNIFCGVIIYINFVIVNKFLFKEE